MEPQLSICNITKILAFNNYENNSRGMNIYLRMIMEENGEIVTYQNSISMDTKKIDKFSLYFDNRIIPCYYVRRQYNSLSLTDNSHFQTIFLFLGMIIFPSVMFLVFYQIIKFPDES